MKFIQLRRNINYWNMLIYNFNHMLNYSILQYILVIKAKYEFNKIYSMKAKYKLLFIATL